MTDTRIRRWVLRAKCQVWTVSATIRAALSWLVFPDGLFPRFHRFLPGRWHAGIVIWRLQHVDPETRDIYIRAAVAAMEELGEFDELLREQGYIRIRLTPDERRRLKARMDFLLDHLAGTAPDRWSADDCALMAEARTLYYRLNADDANKDRIRDDADEF